MSVSVTLPALGESVTEGTVTRWLKAEGERVEADEPLLEVSTDKVDTEIPAPAAGILAAIKVAEDETVEVGAELAIIDDGTGAPAAAAAPAAEPAAAPAPAPVAEAPAAAPAPAAEAPAPAAAPAGGAAGTDVTLPALGESVTEGTVTRWLKEVGEEVTEDEPLLEVSTDKVDTEIPAPVSGVLLEIVVAEDETAEVGAKLAVIGAAGAAPAAAPAPAAPAPVAAPAPAPAAPAPAPAPVAPAAPAPAPAPVAPSAPVAAPAPVPAAPAAAPAPVAAAPVAAPAPVTPAAPAAPSGDDGAYVTPLVRKLAAENGVDLGAVKGTGVGGRIRKQDVVAAAEAARAAAAAPAPAAAVAPAASKAPKLEASPLRGQTVKMTRMRKVIGENMMKALHSQAQLTSVVEVDVTKLMKLRNKAKDAFAAREGVKLSPMPFYVKAAAQALKAPPGRQRPDQRGRGHHHVLRLGEHRHRRGRREGSDDPGHQGCGRPEHRRHLEEDRRAGRQGPRWRPDAGRHVRCHLHHQQHRLARCAVRHRHRAAEPGSHPGHRCHGQASGGHRDRGGHRHRCPRHDVPVALLRPPSGGRRGRRPLPDLGQGDPGGR
ncbi:pyruvate dehydrogenase E2 component (dihydrolipoamide acetyltransferase) [Streptomyces sp. TE3672]